MRTVGTIVVLLVIVGGSVAIVYGVVMRAELVTQPLAFNHTVHLEGASLTCEDCHTDAQFSRDAGLPGKDMCLDCHDIDEEQGSHAEKDKMFAYYERDDDIPWKRVAVTREDVFFSHRRHVGAAGMDCLECHPKQPNRVRPPRTAELVMTMDDCLTCHEERGASNDCLVCHR